MIATTRSLERFRSTLDLLAVELTNMLPEAFWTVEQLAERWGVSPRIVMEHVRHNGLPFVPLGTGEPRLDRPGPKLLRFRPDAVRSWELERERKLAAEDEAGDRASKVSARPGTRGGTAGSTVLAYDPFASRRARKARLAAKQGR